MSALDMIVTTPSTVATLSCNLGDKTCYFYTTKLLWRTMGTGSIPWFLEARPFFYADADEFAAAAEKIGEIVAGLKIE